MDMGFGAQQPQQAEVRRQPGATESQLELLKAMMNPAVVDVGAFTHAAQNMEGGIEEGHESNDSEDDETEAEEEEEGGEEEEEEEEDDDSTREDYVRRAAVLDALDDLGARNCPRQLERRI